MQKQSKSSTWRDRVGLGLIILVSVASLILVLTGVIPLDGSCMPGAAVVDPSCVPH